VSAAIALGYVQARERVMARVSPLDTERVPLSAALGRALARAAVAPHPLPPFDNSAMDGYAVRAADLARGGEARVVGVVAAGVAQGRAIAAGEAARIMTGAPVPDGADAVVPLEQTRAAAPDRVRVESEVTRGMNVRRAGRDVERGQSVLEGGRTLSAHDLALLAAIGQAEVEVTRRPRVGLISTGDELLPVESALEPGRIRDSNLLMLAALVRECGAEVVREARVGDQAAGVIAALREAAGRADAVLTIGGVSEGDFDPVRDSLASFPGLELWRVAMRPGRPQASGRIDGKLFHGFPGNPASVAVSFEVLVRPALLRMGGHADVERPRVRAVAAQDIESRAGRTDFVRVTLEPSGDGFRARPAGAQVSGHLAPQSRAHGLLVVPEAAERVEAGTLADVIVWRLPAPAQPPA
jgi:molybdenum cofactor synthesis domain-containing protein